jgi:hypothetical protein
MYFVCFEPFMLIQLVRKRYPINCFKPQTLLKVKFSFLKRPRISSMLIFSVFWSILRYSIYFKKLKSCYTLSKIMKLKFMVVCVFRRSTMLIQTFSHIHHLNVVVLKEMCNCNHLYTNYNMINQSLIRMP